jgi:hypothetical protein
MSSSQPFTQENVTYIIENVNPSWGKKVGRKKFSGAAGRPPSTEKETESGV